MITFINYKSCSPISNYKIISIRFPSISKYKFLNVNKYCTCSNLYRIISEDASLRKKNKQISYTKKSMSVESSIVRNRLRRTIEQLLFSAVPIFTFQFFFPLKKGLSVSYAWDRENLGTKKELG